VTAVKPQGRGLLLAARCSGRIAALIVLFVLSMLSLVPGAAAREEGTTAPTGAAVFTRTSAATFHSWTYYSSSIDANVPAGSYVMLYKRGSAGPFAYGSLCVSGSCLWYSANPSNVTAAVRDGYELMRLVKRGRMVVRARTPCFDLTYGHYPEICYARYQTPYEFSLPEPPDTQNYGNCGRGTHGLSGSSCMSDPVNSAIGAFLTSATDLELPGLGVPFRFARSYTSADTTVGRLGPGWVDSFGARLTIDASLNVALRGEDGQQLKYTRQADGSYRGAAGTRSTLRAGTRSRGATRFATDSIQAAF
jgi:Domain of unknown function (DUF6531)